MTELKIRSFKDFSVRTKLAGLLLLFTTVALANFFSVNYYKNISKIDTAVVDVAGRQRMLSQKIALLTGMIMRGKEEAREELQETLNLYHNSLITLREGGPAPGIAGNTLLPPSPEAILPSLMAAENQWLQYKAQAETFLQKPLYIISQEAIQKEQDMGVKPASAVYMVNPALAAAMDQLEKQAPALLLKSDMLVKDYVGLSEEKQQGLNILLWVLLSINALFIALSLWVVQKYVIIPVRMICRTAQSLARGDLSENKVNSSNDEIGEAITSLNVLSQNLQKAAGFAKSIGRGHHEVNYTAVSRQDVLGLALLDMRDKLQQVNVEENRRKWAAEGMAAFAEILREQQQDINSMADKIISSIVKYLGANQGAHFMTEEHNEGPYLKLLATYAWGKKKYLQKQLNPGEGLLGQAWLEKDIIYITDVPEGYVEITSGLGRANPGCILIVPLKVDDEVFGMVEIASFRTYETHELNFVQKVAESIAATLSTAKTNNKTMILLEQAQQQEEELRAQEEELRQNMEELTATQEELQRSQAEREKELDNLRQDYNRKLEEAEKSRQIMEKNKLLLFHALTVENAVLDVAGRNRMLSQKIAYLCELLSKGVNISANLPMLEKALTLHETSLKVLKEGGEAPGLKQKYIFPPAEQDLLPVISRVYELWKQFSFHARNLLNHCALPEGSAKIHSSGNFPEGKESLLFIEENSEKMLQLNNELVVKMTEANRAKANFEGIKQTPTPGNISINGTIPALQTWQPDKVKN